MKQRDKPYEEIYDLLAIRVLVNSVPDCYHALGVIHDGWTPLQERIKDYIAQPKSNGYQSLHTTVFGPGATAVRDPDPHARDAPHRGVRHRGALAVQGGPRKSADELDRHLAWFRQVLELQLDAKTPDEFLEFLKLDLYQDEIFVFTPTGDVIQLPKGATPIDFAFAVHTEVGLHCQGAKVNGRIAPLSRAARRTRRRSRSSRSPNARAEPRLAGARAHGPGAPQDPPVAPARGARTRRRSSAARSSTARSSAAACAKPDDAALAGGAKALGLTDVEAPDRVDRAGRHQRRAGAEGALPRRRDAADEPPKPTAFERLVDRVRGTPRACASRASTG